MRRRFDQGTAQWSGRCRTVLSGRYRLDELLGEGGMGVVFRATDLRMPGVRVAIKLLKPEFRQRPELLNILQESVRKVRSIPHPGIAGVYSVESDGERDFVIMELLQGQTLNALLDNECARGIRSSWRGRSSVICVQRWPTRTITTSSIVISSPPTYS